MNSLKLPLSLLSFSLLFFSLLLQTATAVSPAVCNPTQDPSFCRTVLPPGRDNLNYYSRFSLSRSLSQAHKFSLLLRRHLSKHSLSLSTLAVRALQDCLLLSSLNIDFLQSTATTLNSTFSLLDPQQEEVQTLLSALLTNQQTCLEGIQLAASDWSLRNELAPPILNDTKLFSLSLALFTRAWKRKKNRADVSTKSFFFNGASVPVRSTELKFDFSSERRLLQSVNSSVLVRSFVVVNKNGTGNYSAIGPAVDAAPNNTVAGGGYYVIFVKAGVYQEYVEVPKNKKYVMMIGEGVNRTVVTGNRSVVDGWTTFKSATFAVLGQGFVAVNMTFRNTAGPEKHQAVALRNGADQSAFYRCSFEGYQDTLYTHSLRQFYRQCDVYGTVDFIFGNAAVVFQACNLYARLPMKNQNNMVTAQGRTDPNQNTGTSIQGCRILGTADLVTNLTTNGTRTKTYLGRPWKAYSRTVVMQSYLDKVIDPAGWAPWDGDFALSTLYYAEYQNFGPGNATAGRVNWPGYRIINATDAANFTVAGFVEGPKWLNGTGVPYLSGLR